MEEKISHKRNQVYIGNKNLVCGTNLDYKIEGTKKVFVEQITTGEGTKIQAGNKNLGRRKLYDYMGNTKLVCGTIHNHKEGTKS
jgi:hypothetical protein